MDTFLRCEHTKPHGGQSARKENQVPGRLQSEGRLEALKGDKSTAELAQIYGVHPTQITQCKKQLLESASSLFEGRHSKADHVNVDELYKKIGKLEMERDFLVSRPGASGHLS